MSMNVSSVLRSWTQTFGSTIAIVVIFRFIFDVMRNHVFWITQLSSLVLLILLKTNFIITALHLYSTRRFVVAEYVRTDVLVSLFLNVHRAESYSVSPARECGGGNDSHEFVLFQVLVLGFRIAIAMSN